VIKQGKLHHGKPLCAGRVGFTGGNGFGGLRGWTGQTGRPGDTGATGPQGPPALQLGGTYMHPVSWQLHSQQLF